MCQGTNLNQIAHALNAAEEAPVEGELRAIREGIDAARRTLDQTRRDLERAIKATAGILPD